MGTSLAENELHGNIVKEIKYNSFREFYIENFLSDDSDNRRCPYFKWKNAYLYRGESNSEYKLVPSLLRNMSKEIPGNTFFKDEIETLLQFYRKCKFYGIQISPLKAFEKVTHQRHVTIENFEKQVLHFKWIDEDFNNLICLAQHYGIQTRLLDWTKDLDVALYFACSSVLKGNEWAPEQRYTIWALDQTAISLNNYMTRMENRLPFDLYPIEKWPVQFFFPMYYENPNIQAQQGILLSWEIGDGNKINNEKQFSSAIIDDTPFDVKLRQYGQTHNISKRINQNTIVPTILYKFTFPYATIDQSLNYLKSRNVLAGKIFPGVNGIAQELQEEKIIEKYLGENKVYFSVQKNHEIDCKQKNK